MRKCVSRNKISEYKLKEKILGKKEGTMIFCYFVIFFL